MNSKMIAFRNQCIKDSNVLQTNYSPDSDCLRVWYDDIKEAPDVPEGLVASINNVFSGLIEYRNASSSNPVIDFLVENRIGFCYHPNKQRVVVSLTDLRESLVWLTVNGYNWEILGGILSDHQVIIDLSKKT